MLIKAYAKKIHLLKVSKFYFQDLSKRYTQVSILKLGNCKFQTAWKSISPGELVDLQGSSKAHKLFEN